jgi:beta-galactosidase GanA
MRPLSYFLGILSIGMLHAQPPAPGLPSIVRNDNGTYTFLVDGKPYISLGAQLWNSSDWPYILDKEWPQLRELHCNTLEAPVYWQNIEPEQGRYRFAELDSLIGGARGAGLRLVLLWFGSYKNGSSSYAPEWILSHPETYPRMRTASGEELQVLSSLSETNLDADEAAFSALMRHVRQVDGDRQTVILVQVENEPGSLGTDRDYAPPATEAFHQPVPPALLQHLGKQPGTWEEVFGTQAAEAFSAYHMATYVNKVALAGQQEYKLPMYANVWLREDRFRRPGEYPSGGAVSTMIPIWKAAAPALAFLSPDIYLPAIPYSPAYAKPTPAPTIPFSFPKWARGSILHGPSFTPWATTGPWAYPCTGSTPSMRTRPTSAIESAWTINSPPWPTTTASFGASWNRSRRSRVPETSGPWPKTTD